MQDNKLIVLEKIPFTPINQQKLELALSGVVQGIELLQTLVELQKDGLIKAESGPKGMEYQRIWNASLDEERKELLKSFSKKENNVLVIPRFDGYSANLEDNFLKRDASYAVESFKEYDPDMVRWHKGAKADSLFPPKLASFTSKDALAINLVAGLDVEEEQLSYAIEFETLASEEGKPNIQKTFFPVIVNYGDSLDFIQTSFLDAYMQPYFTNMGPFIRGERFLFTDAVIINALRAFARELNFVYFDGYGVFKTLVALISDILAAPEDYENKQVNLLNVYYVVKSDAYPALSEYAEKAVLEAKEAENKFNEFLKTLVLPNDLKISYQFLTLEEASESLTEDVKDEFIKKYL